jgi:hypothetical protein
LPVHAQIPSYGFWGEVLWTKRVQTQLRTQLSLVVSQNDADGGVGVAAAPLNRNLSASASSIDPDSASRKYYKRASLQDLTSCYGQYILLENECGPNCKS